MQPRSRNPACVGSSKQPRDKESGLTKCSRGAGAQLVWAPQNSLVIRNPERTDEMQPRKRTPACVGSSKQPRDKESGLMKCSQGAGTQLVWAPQNSLVIRNPDKLNAAKEQEPRNPDSVDSSKQPRDKKSGVMKCSQGAEPSFVKTALVIRNPDKLNAAKEQEPSLCGPPQNSLVIRNPD